MDLNLLVALDHLLREKSVSAAARRLNLSTPAMSRTLGRIRDAFGDPILVRAGRALVPTARAEAIRGRVRAIVAESHALLSADEPSPATERIFTVRASDAVAAILGASLLRLLRERMPGARLRFAPEGDEDAESLREGWIDLDVGVMGMDAPELRTQVLRRESYVGVVRAGHPLARGRVTTRRFVAFPHVSVSRRGRRAGPIDRALSPLEREVVLVLPSWLAALRVIQESDLVGAMPKSVVECAAVRAFALPVKLPSQAIAQTWHPRFDADPAHRWLRTCVAKLLVPKAPGT